MLLSRTSDKDLTLYNPMIKYGKELPMELLQQFVNGCVFKNINTILKRRYQIKKDTKGIHANSKNNRLNHLTFSNIG